MQRGEYIERYVEFSISHKQYTPLEAEEFVSLTARRNEATSFSVSRDYLSIQGDSPLLLLLLLCPIPPPLPVGGCSADREFFPFTLSFPPPLSLPSFSPRRRWEVGMREKTQKKVSFLASLPPSLPLTGCGEAGSLAGFYPFKTTTTNLASSSSSTNSPPRSCPTPPTQPPPPSPFWGMAAAAQDARCTSSQHSGSTTAKTGRGER